MGDAAEDVWDFNERSEYERSADEVMDTIVEGPAPEGAGQWSTASAKRLGVGTANRNEKESTPMTQTNQPQTQETGRFKTPIFRVSFPQVFTPKAITAGAEAKYSISMLFPKVYTPELCAKFKTTPEEQAKLLQGLKDAVLAAAVGKWGADKSKWPTLKETIDGVVRERSAIVSPWHDGAEKDYDGYSGDIIFASASSKIKPGLVDAKMQPIISPEEFYGGCWAHATVTVFAYDNKKLGVSFGLRNIQKLRDDERFGGGAAPDKDFTPVEVAPAPAPVGAAAAASAKATDPLGI